MVFIFCFFHSFFKKILDTLLKNTFLWRYQQWFFQRKNNLQKLTLNLVPQNDWLWSHFLPPEHTQNYFFSITGIYFESTLWKKTKNYFEKNNVNSVLCYFLRVMEPTSHPNHLQIIQTKGSWRHQLVTLELSSQRRV